MYLLDSVASDHRVTVISLFPINRTINSLKFYAIMNMRHISLYVLELLSSTFGALENATNA